jgi:hypothetical protein
MHYKLFDFENDKHPKTETLQDTVKVMYQQQTSLAAHTLSRNTRHNADANDAHRTRQHTGAGAGHRLPKQTC